MRNSSFGSKEKSGWISGGETTTVRAGNGGAQETDPLIRRGSTTASSTNHQSSSRRSSNSPDNFNLRERRPSRSSPITTSLLNQRFGGPAGENNNNQSSMMNGNAAADPASSRLHPSPNNHLSSNDEPITSYTQINENGSRSGDASLGGNSANSYQNSTGGGSRSLHSLRRSHLLSGREDTGASSAGEGSGNSSPLLEIPEEIYRVRRAALQVLKPLTRTWLIISIGFALTVLLGMARWINLLSILPYWFILLPSWLSHLGLFWCHVSSAKALSTFIAEANESRQRPDSSDHLDRTEYLPLLQRSLKFGLKTGLISFGIFIFEVLFYLRLAHGKLSMTSCFLPIWIMVFGGIIDGIICRTQNILRVISWVLIFLAMVLICLKLDYQHDEIQWRAIISPIVVVLSLASASLIYIVYGHQVGYYQLTESQLTAGNLYSLAALLSIVLVVVIGEIVPLNTHVDVATAIFIVSMAPIVVVLVGMGAWVVSRNEFGRLLLYGGQAQVHPRRLRFNGNGWTSVQGSGVKNIPMFGEVSFRPLNKPNLVELGMCCTCYPQEEDEEEAVQHMSDVSNHPYLAQVSSESTPYTQWQGERQHTV
mmetsp:Transcript_26679/g.57204  ORF Transcript_26679/g.57204 Transcript_26679/m.57204 type:complete len:594 (-) Transcript_26679:649-2430(-)